MSKKPKFQTPSGMHDILPGDYVYFQRVEKVCQEVADFYRFERIETPIAEQAELFLRSIGDATDIVEKQMYSFKTRGGDFLVLRPEGTASVARAFIEHGMNNLPQPVKLWHFGPFFRYERPQADRYRQFWQAGFEVLGEQSPVIDAQIIQLVCNIFKKLKFDDLIIEVNSIGCRHCRSYYKKLLVSYLKSRETSLCSDCRGRLKKNPLRVLDCKEEKCQRIYSQAPQMVDHLCDDCKSHFKQVLDFLDEIELPYNLNPYLVRGLDYYTKTVFEVHRRSKEGEPTLTLAGGGRYDGLIKLLGGKDTPGCGVACGIERIVSFMKEKPLKVSKHNTSKIFLAQLGSLAKKKSLVLVEKLREADIPVIEMLNKDTLKVQLSRANKMGVKYCLILGQKEALDSKIIVRDMESGGQKIIDADNIVKEIKKSLKKS